MEASGRFKFTENDTAVWLAFSIGWVFAGSKWGTAWAWAQPKAGKGTMPASDERLIERQSAPLPRAGLDVSSYPGIGTHRIN